MTGHLHVRIAWIWRTLTVPGAPPRLLLAYTIQCALCVVGMARSPPPASHLLSVSQSTAVLVSFTQRMIKLFESIATDAVTEVGREVGFHRAIGARQGVRHRGGEGLPR